MREHESGRRTRVVVVAAAIVLAMVAAPASATHDVMKRFAYTGNDFYVVGPDYAGFVVSGASPAGVAPMGRIRVVPDDDHLVVTIRDAAFRRGTASVVLTQFDGGRGWGRGLCIPVRQPTVVTGLTPGALVEMTVYDLTYRHHCDHGATAGVLTVTGAFTG